jgi:hypothetical protein
MITKFKIFEANNKKYIVTSSDLNYVFTLDLDDDEYSYMFIEINDREKYKLKIFNSHKDAKEFINLLVKNYPTYRKYDFEILSQDKFEILLNAKKYNI